MLSLHSNTFINVTTRCSMSCLGCPIPTAFEHVEHDWKTLLSKSRFSPTHRNTINLYGGDPVKEGALLGLVMGFTQTKKKIGLWTPLNCTSDTIAQLAPFIHTWYVYVPSPDAEDYQFRVGSQTWKHFLEKLRQLTSERSRVVLVTSVDETTVGYLPYLYEFAYYKKLQLLLLVSNPTKLTRDQKRHVYYFSTHKNISVYSVKYENNTCLGAPVCIPFYRLQKLRNLYNSYRLF